MSEKLVELAAQLRSLDESYVMGGVAKQHIVVRVGEGDDVVIEANTAGLVHLASELLRLAKATSGSHYHLDEAGMADSADPAVVFSYNKASWD